MWSDLSSICISVTFHLIVEYAMTLPMLHSSHQRPTHISQVLENHELYT